MKKIIIAVIIILLLSSCATLYPGKSYKRAKPKKIKNKSYQAEFILNKYEFQNNIMH